MLVWVCFFLRKECLPPSQVHQLILNQSSLLFSTEGVFCLLVCIIMALYAMQASLNIRVLFSSTASCTHREMSFTKLDLKDTIFGLCDEAAQSIFKRFGPIHLEKIDGKNSVPTPFLSGMTIWSIGRTSLEVLLTKAPSHCCNSPKFGGLNSIGTPAWNGIPSQISWKNRPSTHRIIIIRA